MKISIVHSQWRPSVIRTFEALFRPWMRGRLGGIYVTGLPAGQPDDTSVLLAANHVSWWDAFILREVQRRSGAACPLITLMDAGELLRFPFFRWMGVIGLRPTPGALRGALRQVAAFREAGPTWVSFFPQGRIWPSWRRPLGFHRGVGRFARVLTPCAVWPVGLHLEPLAGLRPAAFVAVGEPLQVTSDRILDVGALEERVAAALDFIHMHLTEHGEAAARWWPDPHRPLPAEGAVTNPPVS